VARDNPCFQSWPPRPELLELRKGRAEYGSVDLLEFLRLLLNANCPVHGAGGLRLRRFAHPVPLAARGLVRI
jgi:hypothetical protein